MTIALGILTGDGVVVAADTLETRGAGFAKTNIPKILTGGTTGKSGCGCYAVTGAGDSAYLNGIKQEIADLFLNHSRAGTVNSAFESELKKLVRRFHVQHIIPFAKYPDYERPSIDILIASSHSHSHRLWVTNRPDTSGAFPYATVGCGSGYAKALLDRLNLPWADMKLVKIVAAYVVFSTKNNVEGCGGNTHVATVSGDIAAYLPRDVIEEMEKLFAYYNGIEARAFYYSIGYPSESQSEDLGKLSSWFDSLRSDFMSLAAKM